jgi:hypothetical protein
MHTDTYPKDRSELLAFCHRRIETLRSQTTPETQRLLSKFVLVVEELQKRGTVNNSALSK